MVHLKDYLKKCYPEKKRENESFNIPPHALDALLKFLLIQTSKCSEAAKWIEEHRLEKDLKKKPCNFTLIEISITLLTKITEQNSKNLISYSRNIYKVLDTLFHHSPQKDEQLDLQIKQSAMKLFCQLADSKFKESANEIDLTQFLNIFLEFANDNNPKEELRVATRQLGIKGLHRIILRTHDLDNFVNRYIDIQQKDQKYEILPTILANLLEFTKSNEISKLPERALDKNAAHEDMSLSTFKCFSSLTYNVSTITTQSILQSTFNFLEKEKNFKTEKDKKISLWESPLAPTLLKTFSAKNNHIVVSEIIKNIELQDNFAAKERILNALRIWLSEEKGEKRTFQPVIEVLSPLARMIQDLKEEKPKKSEKKEKKENLNSNFLDSVTEICFYISSGIKEFSERFEAASFFLGKALDKNEKRVQLLEISLKIVSAYPEFPPSLSIPLKFLESLEKILNFSNSQCRVLVFKIYQVFIQKTGNNFKNYKNHFTNSFRNDLYNSIQLPDNGPQNFQEIFRILTLFVERIGAQELETSIPFVLGLEDFIEHEKTNISKEISSSIYSLVSSYLIFVAKKFSNVQLEEFVNEISGNELSPEFEYPEFKAKSKKWKFTEKIEYPKTFFDKEKTTSILSQIKSETPPSELQQLMMRPISSILKNFRVRHDSKRQSVSVPHSSNLKSNSKKYEVQFKFVKEVLQGNFKKADNELHLKNGFDESATSIQKNENELGCKKEVLLGIKDKSQYMSECKSLDDLAFPTLTPFTQ